MKNTTLRTCVTATPGALSTRTAAVTSQSCVRHWDTPCVTWSLLTWCHACLWFFFFLFLAYLQWHLVAFTWFRVNSSLYTWAFYHLWYMYLVVFVTMELVTVILTATKCTLTTLQQCTLKIYHLLIIIHCNMVMTVILSHVFSDSYLRWWRIFLYLYIFVHFTYILLTV